MKTLVVHPDDRSTDFLRPIYKDIRDITLITGVIKKAKLREQIPSFDRVILLGHGSELGLMAVGKFPQSGMYIIDESFATVLKDVKDLVCIWCHAKKFVHQHIKQCGFYTDMFISELDEAYYYLSDEEFDQVFEPIMKESNDHFAKTLGTHVSENMDLRFKNLTNKYNQITSANPVARYNTKRLFYMQHNMLYRNNQSV